MWLFSRYNDTFPSAVLRGIHLNNSLLPAFFFLGSTGDMLAPL